MVLSVMVLASAVLALVGTVYPAYATAKAVTAKETDEMTRWCQYWLIFAMMSLVAFAVDMVGSMLPFYWEARVVFALWLVADKFKGATFLCVKYVEPALATHQATITNSSASRDIPRTSAWPPVSFSFHAMTRNFAARIAVRSSAALSFSAGGSL